MHLWTVVRVLQHTCPAKKKNEASDKLNLSSEDSFSVGSLESDDLMDGLTDETRSTLEMGEFK